ncbi:chymotrypsin-2-like [Copidosoma floridanum]|uniref:chymotrypsin-2-like n=1 Tax=Copidosoma floridanum TaxID=29053 RepID=UPI0006C9D5A5|nr:chymotrypsin-2-like [Copidosoma floridanum]
MALLKTLAALLVIQVTSAQYEGAIINTEQLPFYVLVETITASGSKFWCSGALVNNKYVITNAHCLYHFDSNKPNVIVGGNSHVDKKAKIIRTNETFIHTDYKFDTDEHDIAVMQLNSKVEFSPFVRAVNLLKFNEVDENTEIMLVGYRRESSSGGPRVRFSIVLETSKPVCSARRHFVSKEW